MTSFHARLERNRESATTVVLQCSNPDRPGVELEAQISPGAGSNLFSLRRGTVELLHRPDKPPHPGDSLHYGFPILYPTPNRVRNSRFTFEGRTFEFPPNERSHFIHGLVHSCSWQCDNPVVDETSAEVQTFLNWTENERHFDRFPFEHRLEMNFRLQSQGIRLTFTVVNHDPRPLPFGFGFHPYFRILGDRRQTFLKVPATWVMESEELLPTGKLKEVEGSNYDLRNAVSLETLNLDDVYAGMVPEKPAYYEARQQGLRVLLEASSEFTHMVVYTPPDKPYFCMENQTCSTDAHNLFSKGLVKESHLLIARPGQSVSGWVQLRVAEL